MVNFICLRCKYKTEIKSNFLNHLSRKEKCEIAIKGGLDVDPHYLLNLVNNPLSLLQRVEIDKKLDKLEKLEKDKIYINSNNSTNSNITNSTNSNITNNITNNSNVTIVLNLNDTNTHNIENIEGVKDFQDLVRILHGFKENRNIYKPTINKDKRIRALVNNGWITYKSLKDIPSYLEKLKEIIDFTIRPDNDDTIDLEDKEIIDQVNMGLYDIGKKFKMNN